jgi:hypothetical protein
MEPAAQSSRNAVAHVNLLATQHSLDKHVDDAHVTSPGNGGRSSSAAQAKLTHVFVVAQHSSLRHSGDAHVVNAGGGEVLRSDPKSQRYSPQTFVSSQHSAWLQTRRIRTQK